MKSDYNQTRSSILIRFMDAIQELKGQGAKEVTCYLRERMNLLPRESFYDCFYTNLPIELSVWADGFIYRAKVTSREQLSGKVPINFEYSHFGKYENIPPICFTAAAILQEGEG